jgi:hypothetical protein
MGTIPVKFVEKSSTRGKDSSKYISILSFKIAMIMIMILEFIGPSEVRALPVRRCRLDGQRGKRKWPLLMALFFFSPSHLLFSQKGLS